jgi:ubiquinone biosynthesis protein UbiJ|tara:strand:- start:99 stop:683 length:585 start_codon:yes stop_codon:yes gene_type:complete
LKTRKQFIKYCNDILQGERFSKILPENFLDELSGKRIKISFSKINLELFFKIEKNTIFLLENSKNNDVEFVASPFDFFMYVITKGSDKFSNRIKINGDIETAERVNNFLYKSEKFRLVLLNLIGKNRTEKFESILETLNTTISEIFENATEDLSDFLIDDINLFPTEKDINKFLDDVDNLRSRTDKLVKKYAND